MAEYLYRGLRQSVTDSESLSVALARELGLAITHCEVEREALDARRKPAIYHVYSLRFGVAAPSPQLDRLLRDGRIAVDAPETLPAAEPTMILRQRPVIVGCGPAGLFAALELARLGHRPLVLERGQAVATRAVAVERLWTQGELDPESNMQFGEGGAGAFSDGKLSTGKSSPLDRWILQELVSAGAPPEVLVSAKPHIGTDRLRQVVTALRREIESLGGEVRFGARVDGLEIAGGVASGVRVGNETIHTDAVVLAIGHSARDTLAVLQRAGVAMAVKPFAVGLRIEHPAAFVNEAQYGPRAAALLPAADYKMTYTFRGTGVYSFCMCPGGEVVCSASEPAGQVTNGMSYHARDGAYSNSALVVAVDPARLGRDEPLAAVAYQRELEQAAFQLGGGGFGAPAQRASDYLQRRLTAALPETTYRPGAVSARLDELLPAYAARALAAGLEAFDRSMPGFIEQGLLLGIETRTSSPVRLLRDELGQSTSVRGLYLLGEGSGYAGGIMTCARDGLRWARQVAPREDSE